MGQEELWQFAQHNRRRSACGFDTVKINYVIVKGKHTNNELGKPHNNTIPVTASRERKRERMRKGYRKWKDEEGNGMQFKPVHTGASNGLGLRLELGWHVFQSC